MSQYNHDQPIDGTEESPDLFNREAFALHLAEILILDPKDDCLTVSLEGEWGYGKSSVINLVKKHCLHFETKPIIVEYNPWLGGKAEALIQDFLVQLSTQLDIPDRPKEVLRVAKEVLSYSELFRVVKFIPGAEPWASTIEQVFKRVGKAANKIGELKTLDLLGRKKKVQDALASLNIPIVVIIDDIDRLPPDDAFQMIRLIKAVADFRGTSFLLAFDAEYLTNALEKQGIAKSDQYVDKVVQLRVPLPLISHADMQKLADIELSKLAPDRKLTDYFKGDQERLSLLYHRYIKYLVRSPRELKRIFNHLRFVLRQTEGKVCFSDLYGLSALVIKAPGVYQHIKETPAAYIGKNFDEELVFEKPEDVVNGYAEDRENKIVSCHEKDRGFVRGVIKELFPLIEGRDHGQSESKYDELGRIAAAKRLYVAMHYQVPARYADDTDVVAFLNGDLDRVSYLNRSINDNFVERLFELLSQNIDKVKDENILPVIKALYDVFLPSEYLKQFEENKAAIFEFDPARYLKWITFDLIRKADNKKSLILDLVEIEAYVFITADIIRMLMVQFGDEETQDPKESQERWLDDNAYKRIKTTWVDTVIRNIINGNLLSSYFASRVFFALKRADKEKTKALMAQLMSEEHAAMNIALLIGRTGIDSMNGLYSQIDRKDFEEVIDFDALIAIAKHELESNEDLPSDLKAIYSSIVTGEKFYLKDASKGEKF